MPLRIENERQHTGKQGQPSQNQKQEGALFSSVIFPQVSAEQMYELWTPLRKKKPLQMWEK